MVDVLSCQLVAVVASIKRSHVNSKIVRVSYDLCDLKRCMLLDFSIVLKISVLTEPFYTCFTEYDCQAALFTR